MASSNYHNLSLLSIFTCFIICAHIYTTLASNDNDAYYCDPLVEDRCLLPFPNNFWTKRDDTTVTNIRLNLTAGALPIDNFGNEFQVDEFNELDGFSAMSAICTYWPNLSLSNVPHHWNIARSLEANSPTIIIDTSTNERVAHWSELDESAAHSNDRAFMIWPSKRLKPNTTYIVAMRNLLSRRTMSPYAAKPAFAILRDNLPSNDTRITSRRSEYATIFKQLKEAGITDISQLQLAWQFTTGSDSSVRDRLLFMRSDSLHRLPKGGPDYEIASIENYKTTTDKKFNTSLTYKLIRGNMSVPLYLNSNVPGGRLVLNDDGIPVFQGFTNVTFSVQIPLSLYNAKKEGRYVQYGHGLFGNQLEIQANYLQEMANTYGYVYAAVDWWGLSSSDENEIEDILVHNISNFGVIPDRCQQALINQLALTKLMTGSFLNNPNVAFSNEVCNKGSCVQHFVPPVDKHKKNYDGNSLGGILGSLFMAVTQDITRGVVGVPGAPFSLLLPRSLDYAKFAHILTLKYDDAVDRVNLLNLFQLLWDRGGPGGYMDSITSNTLPDTPPHHILLHYGLGDAQVTWLGCETLARSMGAHKFVGNVREQDELFFGLRTTSSPFFANSTLEGGAVMVGFNFGAPPVPRTNIPANAATDVHECVRRDPRAQKQMNLFFTEQQVIDLCNSKGCNPIDPPIHLNHCPLPD